MIAKIPARLRRDPGEEPRVGTHSIQAKIFRGKRVKQLVFREFPNVKQAQVYFKELISTDGEEIVDKSKNGHVTSLLSGIVINTNYSMERILKGLPPRQKLHIIADPRQLRQRAIEKAPMPETKLKPAKARKRKISTGETVPIKAICQELDIDPRKARQKLRKAAADGKIPHLEKGRWDFDPKEVKAIKAILRV